MSATGGRAGRPVSSARKLRETQAASTASTAGVRQRMQAQRVRDTRPELAVRRLLHAAGLRYRVDRAPLPGLRRRADVVHGPTRTAVFIDGCFWHGCPEHGNLPRANAVFWQTKLQRNRERDVETDGRLRAAGWTVLRAWEHEDPVDVARGVLSAVAAARKV